MTNYNKNYTQIMIAIFIIFVGVAALGIAWFLQHVWNMTPCGLCLFERWPYRILILLGLIGLWVPTRYFTLILWGGLVVLLISMGLSFLHIGVEQMWWRSPLPECNANLLPVHNLGERLQSLPDLPSKPCDVPSYLFPWLPMSLTMLNGLYSLVLFFLFSWWLIKENHNRRIYF